MSTLRIGLGLALLAGAALAAQGRGGGAQQPPSAPLKLPADTPRITALKTEAAAEVDKLKDFSQLMVDQIFSSWCAHAAFADLGDDLVVAERPPDHQRLQIIRVVSSSRTVERSLIPAFQEEDSPD